MKPNCFFVISRFTEDVSWIKEYTNNYIVYNKGEDNLDSFNVKKMPNFGGCQYDICHFIHENYENLPEYIGFLQGRPFDHCNKNKFEQIISDNIPKAIESYEEYLSGNPPACKMSTEYNDNGFAEINDSWYISHCNRVLATDKGHPITCPFTTFDGYMESLFENYTHLDYVRFAPGSQYLIHKNNALYYSKHFWKTIMDIFPTTIGLNGGTEAHLVERAMWLILNNIYIPKEQLR